MKTGPSLALRQVVLPLGSYLMASVSSKHSDAVSAAVAFSSLGLLVTTKEVRNIKRDCSRLFWGNKRPEVELFSVGQGSMAIQLSLLRFSLVPIQAISGQKDSFCLFQSWFYLLFFLYLWVCTCPCICHVWTPLLLLQTNHSGSTKISSKMQKFHVKLT